MKVRVWVAPHFINLLGQRGTQAAQPSLLHVLAVTMLGVCGLLFQKWTVQFRLIPVSSWLAQHLFSELKRVAREAKAMLPQVVSGEGLLPGLLIAIFSL